MNCSSKKCDDLEKYEKLYADLYNKYSGLQNEHEKIIKERNDLNENIKILNSKYSES